MVPRKMELEVDLYLSSVCRLCADNNPNGVLLFSENSPDGDLSTYINTYLPFKVNNDGKLPQTVCPGCNIQLQATVQFFDLVIEGQRKIRDMWKEQVMQKRKLEKQGINKISISPDVPPPLIVSETDSLSFDNATVPTQEEGVQDVDEEAIVKGLLHEVEKQLNIEVFDTGSMYAADDPIILKAEGLDKPRKKRGRPKKVVQPELEVLTDNAISRNVEVSNDDSAKKDESTDKEEDLDGRKRRKRRVPQRYKEAVQGKELERIFKEEGVIDEEEEKEPIMELVECELPTVEIVPEPIKEVIGHLETQEGQDLGEVVIVSSKIKARRKYPLRKKVRFQCEICGRGFLHHGRYMFHKSIHKGVKFECTTCTKRFSTKENLELHQKISGHSGEGIIESVDDDNNDGNTEEGHRVSGEINCKYCEKTFTSKRTYENHLVTDHQEPKPYQCEVCQKSFSHLATLKSHLLTHEEVGKEKGYPCNLCGKKLNHPSSVLYHREAEHNNGRRFVCNKCGKSFKHKQLLQRHQLVHSDNRPFQCALCTACFKTKANLLNHQATHTGEKKHKCEHCGQQFAHKTSLTLHYRWHSGHKPYQCTVCKKQFSQKGNLQEHYRIHTGEKPFNCNVCSRKFTTSSQFKLHMKRHTGERPWKCEYCSKSFLHKDAWKCHIRRHRGERPFQCPINSCNKEFPEQWALKKHMRSHTGEKPYSCTICGKPFADCSNLTKHKKVHAREAKIEEERVELRVWNIVKSHLEQSAAAIEEKELLKPSDDVQQIIYVTYQQEEEESEVVSIKESENFIIPSIIDQDVPLQDDSLALTPQPLQVTDDQGNPIHFTMQDGSSLQITTTDGQNLHVTTKDGQVIPVQITTSDGQPINTAPLELPEEQVIDQDIITKDPIPALEFTAADGQKYQIITPYDGRNCDVLCDVTEASIDQEYLGMG